MKVDYAERARAHIGTRFRPQGRSSGGLDCIGLILCTYAVGVETRRNYRLRGDLLAELETSMAGEFRRVAQSQLRPGDVMLMRVSDDQLHLGVRTCSGFVHAHAGLRRVVETPGLPKWPILSVFRKRTRTRGI